LVDEGNLRKVKKQKRRENDKREKEKIRWLCSNIFLH
jgi:hypothetical protein